MSVAPVFTISPGHSVANITYSPKEGKARLSMLFGAHTLDQREFCVTKRTTAKKCETTNEGISDS